MKALLAAALLLGSVSQVFSQMPGIDALPVSTIFVTSNGMWEREAVEDTSQTTDKSASARPEPTRGYYKVVAMRQPDGTAKIYLQQIAYTADGLSLIHI